jgi:hypothetical protein
MAMRQKPESEKTRDAGRSLDAGKAGDKSDVLDKIAKAGLNPLSVAKLREEIAKAKANMPPYPKRSRR